jgi:hypothetical protein
LEYYQHTQPEDSPLESCYFHCYVDKETGNILFKCGWGESSSDLENFAFMMSQINSGEYEDSILEELSRQGSNVGEEDLAVFMTLYRTLMQKPEKSELVIRPTDLKLE